MVPTHYTWHEYIRQRSVYWGFANEVCGLVGISLSIPWFFSRGVFQVAPQGTTFTSTSILVSSPSTNGESSLPTYTYEVQLYSYYAVYTKGFPSSMFNQIQDDLYRLRKSTYLTKSQFSTYEGSSWPAESRACSLSFHLPRCLSSFGHTDPNN